VGEPRFFVTQQLRIPAILHVVIGSRSDGKLKFAQRISKKLDPRKFRVAYIHQKLAYLESVVWIQADEIAVLEERIRKLENK
jgi:hypothetical protein